MSRDFIIIKEFLAAFKGSVKNTNQPSIRLCLLR